MRPLVFSFEKFEFSSKSPSWNVPLRLENMELVYCMSPYSPPEVTFSMVGIALTVVRSAFVRSPIPFRAPS